MEKVKKKYKSGFKPKHVLIERKVRMKKLKDEEFAKINGYLSKPFDFVNFVLITNSDEIKKLAKKLNNGR